ncbi:MAG TPA: prolyl oligopeptidase family serine peptidase [Polyangiaceae bacterium]|jgi:prolyl oligopeptidase|nr:prolyl oligopeptidase family serine peptidase [Polyangiaceae bacterium]
MKAPYAALLAALLASACGSPETVVQAPVEPTRSAPPARAMTDKNTQKPDQAPARASILPYPATRASDAKDVIHGVEVRDPYRWLEDVSSPEVKAWMEAQDSLTRAELKKLPERDAIAARLKELFYIDAVYSPRHRKGRYFYTRRHATKEKSVVYWKQGKQGAEKVLFDPNEWSKDGSVSLGGWQVSWDGKTVAYQVRKNNSDEATLYLMDVATGKKSEVDVIEGAKYASASWTPSGDGFYYTWLPTDPNIPVADRPGFAEVRFHKVGEDPKKDAVIRERTGDPTKFVSAYISKDGRFLFSLVHHGWTSTDVYFRDQKRPLASKDAWTPLVAGNQAHYNVESFKDKLYVHTDEGAPRWRLFEVDPARPERAAWKEIVPERADATLADVSVIGGRLAMSYLKNASSLLEVRELDGKLVREVPLPGIGSVGGPIGLPDEDEAYFQFESFTVPMEIYSTSMKTGKTEIYTKTKVPVDPSPFMVEQVFYPSKDGTRISMFIVRRKDLKKDGSARMLLTGYGGFLSSETPAFISSIYPWIERGGVYAVPNLRGGGEYGEEWHKAGMLLKKQNVFDDFITAAEYLIKEGYTSPERLVIKGGSNGGLLVGAALTQRPDLFRAVLCGVPLLDMVRYHLFGSGKTWISEYGSAEDPAQFKALHAYSPYHHVKPGTRYPAVLLLSADSDDRVDPMHARKFAAALQATSTGGPVLLRIERNAGHGGADLIKAAVEQGADQYAFALAQTGGGELKKAGE